MRTTRIAAERAGERGATAARARFESESTAIGIQTLVPGVAPIRPFDRLAARAAAPLAAKAAQRACDHGLFDLAARDQLDLFAPRGAR